MLIIEEKIKKSAFSFGKLPEYISFIEWLESENISIDDLKKYQIDRIESIKNGIAELNKNVQLNKCPECKRKTYTSRPLKNNIKGFTKHLFCVNDECCFEEYF